MSASGDGARIVKTWEFAMVPTAALHAAIPMPAKMLFVLYCMFADKNGGAHPGGKRCAELMGVSEDTVRRAKADLVSAGLIRVEPRHIEGRRSTDNVFLLGRTSRNRSTAPAETGVPPQQKQEYPPSTDGSTELDPVNEIHLTRAIEDGSQNLQPPPAKQPFTLIQRLQAVTGCRSSEAVGAIARLREKDIADTLIDEAIGFAGTERRGTANIRYIEKVAEDWFHQRAGGGK